MPDNDDRTFHDPSAIKIPAVLIRDGDDRGATMRAGIVDPVVIPVTIVRKLRRPDRPSEKNLPEK